MAHRQGFFGCGFSLQRPGQDQALGSKRSRSPLNRIANPDSICGVDDFRSGLWRPFGAFRYMDARGSDRPRLVHRRGDNIGASLLVASWRSRTEGLTTALEHLAIVGGLLLLTVL